MNAIRARALLHRVPGSVIAEGLEGLSRMLAVTERVADAGANATGSTRDLRLDFFRGLALIFIFVDHVPGNLFGHFTLRNFGFVDAAELFVFVAGYAAALAYGKAFARHGFAAGVRRVGKRLLEIYAAHLVLLVACVGGIAMAARALENPLYY